MENLSIKNDIPKISFTEDEEKLIDEENINYPSGEMIDKNTFRYLYFLIKYIFLKELTTHKTLIEKISNYTQQINEKKYPANKSLNDIDKYFDKLKEPDNDLLKNLYEKRKEAIYMKYV